MELGGNVKPRAVCLDTQDNIYVSDVEVYPCTYTCNRDLLVIPLLKSLLLNIAFSFEIFIAY